MRELEYPFDSEYILKKSKSIKKTLLADGSNRIKKNIAILGGSTTHDVVKVMELFLLNQGIEPSFYESEYAQYWQDVMFDNEELRAFNPDIIYVHTSNRNIQDYPIVTDTKEEVLEKRQKVVAHFNAMWEKIRATYNCPIIQNNFELPFFRLLGNKDASDYRGRVNFISALNMDFYDYADSHDSFYINDINYLSACYGVDKWSDPFYWHMYKYAMCLDAIPALAFNVVNIIKAIYGKNKKGLVLDLDNTLWGGIVGDDGADNIEIGQETSVGQVFSEIQTYIKAQKDLGIVLNIDSKNDEENALAGLNRPDGILKPDDFVEIKANWDPKSINLTNIAKSLNIGEDSLVFVDDNPAEREIIRQQNSGVAVPEIGTPEQYIRVLDHSGFFETIKLSEDDAKKTEMYKANAIRAKEESSFSDYAEYLKSLEMKAEIKPFCPLYNARIAQLTNKSNQFNLTTKRYSQADIEAFATDPDYITLYGKLEDKFGDNGVVSVVNAKKENAELHIDLWLMSCRVLKRDMEYAMMDELVRQAKASNISTIYGYYFKTAKNAMVKDFYKLHGFECIEMSEESSRWMISVDDYENRNKVISVIEE